MPESLFSDAASRAGIGLSAIEKLSDHVTATHHPDIGRIKDMGSAAVGVGLAIAGFTWLLAAAEWLGLI